MAMLALFAVLLLPAFFTAFARTISGGLWVALIPGAISLVSVFRFWQFSQEGDSGGAGIGAGIIVTCALSCGLSAAAAMVVALVRHSARPARFTGEPDPGFTPQTPT